MGLQYCRGRVSRGVNNPPLSHTPTQPPHTTTSCMRVFQLLKKYVTQRHTIATAATSPNVHFNTFYPTYAHRHAKVTPRELSLSPTSFSFLAIKQWNELPNDIKSISEFRVFKRKLKDFFISQYDWTYMILSDRFYTLFLIHDSRFTGFYFYLRFNESSLIWGPLWKKVTLIRLSWAILESKLLHVIVCVIFGLFSN